MTGLKEGLCVFCNERSDLSVFISAKQFSASE